MADESKFVFKDATVIVGTDEETNITVVFVVMHGRSVAITFPRSQGTAKEISSDEMRTFFENTPDSVMLKEIKKAWWEKQAQ